jgi:hypothetical protein
MKILALPILLLVVVGLVFKLTSVLTQPAEQEVAESEAVQSAGSDAASSKHTPSKNTPFDAASSDDAAAEPAVEDGDSQGDRAAAAAIKARPDRTVKSRSHSQPASPWAAPASRSDSGPPANPFVHHGRGGSGHQSWSSYEDAVDYVGAEIYDALEDRPTLVVWLFDSSPSAVDVCDRVTRRFESVYQTLDKSRPPSADDSEALDAAPLVSVVGTFGKSVEFLTPEPTADRAQLVQAVKAIHTDTSGEEHTFEAVDKALKQFGKLHSSKKRLMLVVVVTDEVGDDADEFIENLLPRLRKNAIPVYVLGPSAPFGSTVGVVSKARGEGTRPVRQGPESLMSEVIDMGGWSGPLPPLDSGFGPFALTRLAIGSGGRYLAVRLITGYDPQRMAAYAPDYVSRAAYEELLQANKARRALVEAGRLAHVDVVGRLETVFPKKDEAGFKRTLDKAQQGVARLEPRVRPFYDALAAGEGARPQLTGARWQAGYDLALGRASAARSRIEGYNSALATMKLGRNFPDKSHSTWVLRPTDDVKGDSGLEKLAKQAHKYLERVISDHPDTPWATVAARELSEPLGWEWTSR